MDEQVLGLLLDIKHDVDELLRQRAKPQREALSLSAAATIARLGTFGAMFGRTGEPSR